MGTQDAVMNWLLEESSPGVRVRALTGLCGLPPDHPEVRAVRQAVVQTLGVASDLSWRKLEGLRLIYNLAALAETGLSREDVGADPVVERLLAQRFDANCGKRSIMCAGISPSHYLFA